MSDIPFKILGHENQSLTYTNAVALYDEGGSIILNFALIDRLPEVLRDLFEDEINKQEIDQIEALSVGRFVISYSTAHELLELLEEVLEESNEQDNENED